MTSRSIGPAWVVCICLGAVLLTPSGVVFNPIAEVAASPGETTLRIGFLGSLSTLNPFIAYSENDLFFSSLLYDGLVSVDQDLNPVPNLAESCYAVPEVLPYGSVWQYNLTHNAAWHDGEPMTADDVIFTIAYQTGLNFYMMWRNEPYTFWIDHASIVDSYTVRIHFKNSTGDPFPCAFGDKLTLPIVPKHIWENIPPVQAGFSFLNSFPVGTGPFMATSSTYNELLAGVNVTLLRNPDYHWATDYGKQVHFDKLDLRYYINDTLLKDALLNNEIDVARCDFSNYTQLESEIAGGLISNFTTMSGLRPDGYFSDVGFNMNTGGGNLARLDPWLRVGLAMATNRSELVDEVYYGHAIEGSTLVSPVYPDWHLTVGTEDEIPYDLLGAAILLQLAGYEDTDSDGVLEVGPDSMTVQMGWEAEGTELRFNLLVRVDQPEDIAVAMALQVAYLQIGVVTTIVLCDPSVFLTVIYAYNYDMMIFGWTQNVDPNQMLFSESSYAINGWSDNHYFNPEYNENYTLSVMDLDSSARASDVRNCQLINYIETPYIVLAYLNQTYVRRNDTFTGWGDWSAHPGRSLDARWGANPLFFDLVPNSAPIASFTVVPTTGDTTTSFEFNASGSSDAEDGSAALEVRWDWENDGTWDTDWSTTKTAQHTFAAPGNYTVALAVRDTGGLTNTTTEYVDVSEFPIPEFGSTAFVVLVMTALTVAISVRRTRSREVR